MYAEAVFDQRVETWLALHQRAVAALGGDARLHDVLARTASDRTHDDGIEKLPAAVAIACRRGAVGFLTSLRRAQQQRRVPPNRPKLYSIRLRQ